MWKRSSLLLIIIQIEYRYRSSVNTVPKLFLFNNSELSFKARLIIQLNLSKLLISLFIIVSFLAVLIIKNRYCRWFGRHFTAKNALSSPIYRYSWDFLTTMIVSLDMKSDWHILANIMLNCLQIFSLFHLTTFLGILDDFDPIFSILDDLESFFR